MEVFLNIAGGIAGAVLLYFGAEYLIRGGVNLARALGISALVIGLTVVAFGTSMPELVVSIIAALRGSGDISLGNVIGSNICNIALILGLCAAVSPLAVNRDLFRRDVPVMAGVSLLLAALVWFIGGMDRISAILLLVIFAGYMVWQVIDIRRGRAAQEVDGEADAKPCRWPLALLLVVLGLIGLVAGAKLFVDGAVYVARLIGISEAVIGLTIVSLGTSLPELATSLLAAIKHERDIAIGNIVGSNIFNILIITGIAPLVRPLRTVGITAVDLGVMLGCALLLWIFMATGRKLSRAEGLLLLAVYITYNGYLAAKSAGI